jgi:PqqD family protein of HPr-rel-A system
VTQDAARYGAVSGVRIEPLGDVWAVFSPLSGQTHLINDGSLAVLDLLNACGVVTAAALADRLAESTGDARETVAAWTASALDSFVPAGLAHRLA